MPLLRVRGNHDNAVAFRIDCGCGEAFKHLSVVTREYMWQVLSREQLDWIGEPPTSLELESGRPAASTPSTRRPATTSSATCRRIPATRTWRAELKLAGADIVLTGHTHKPFMREIGGRLLVNVGSVGQPRDGIPRVSYAIIEDGRVELKREPITTSTRPCARIRALPLNHA